MWWTNPGAAAGAGFSGFNTIADLRASALRSVPALRGVYVVLRPSPLPPAFRVPSPGGHFKGKDPTVDAAMLRAKWIPSVTALYVGKAGAEGGSATLRSRLKSYLQFGAGEPVGHWGGRYIWQLADAESLVICWKETAEEEPLVVERRMLDEFVAALGRLPFANCRR